MPVYSAPIRDFQFGLREWLEIDQYKEIEGFDEGVDIIDPVLDESARFTEEVLFPLNQSGDEQGLTFKDGEVTLPDGFVDAYKTYVEMGWASLACTKDYGGQGLPNVINTPLIEMICSTNLSFGLLPGLTHGAYTALRLFGTDKQKETYLPKMISGEWSGIMCLTEPQSGTDLGLNRTTATPVGDDNAPLPTSPRKRGEELSDTPRNREEELENVSPPPAKSSSISPPLAGGIKGGQSESDADTVEDQVKAVLGEPSDQPSSDPLSYNDTQAYHLNGTKIFISYGEHDATENIIALVLARLPDAPEGIKGISLFVVPKYLVNDDGSVGERNGMSCASIEHKMGIHGSPTCVMNFDNAKGWLVGEPHKGMRAMFTMMNEARLLVGIQGQGIVEVAYQNALDYAKERLQGRKLKGGPKYPEKPADPITVHPDVRRMLLTMRAYAEGGRILSLWASLQVDLAHHHPDETKRQEADELLQLLTPIVKAYLTDNGTNMASMGMMVLGGYGYIKEYGMEQYMRDAKICEIYEGTNGIQALDLVGRKLGLHTGRLLRRFFHPCEQFIEEHRHDDAMAEFTKPLYQGFKSLQNASLWIAQKGLGNPEEAAQASVDYLRLFGHVALAYIWAKSAKIALDALENGTSETEFYEAKLATARFFLYKILPEHYSLLAKITAGVKYLDMPDVE